MQVAGVDGCRGGWLVVRAEAGQRLRLLDLSIASTFEELIASTRDCAAVAVDIPIGLSDGPDERIADKEARRLLGKFGASSVFPAPVRRALSASSYADAARLTREAGRTGLSPFAYGIFKKVKEADEVMAKAFANDPRVQDRIVEVHPEVCFWKLNGKHPMERPKRTPEGARARRLLLAEAFATPLASVSIPPGAALDDLHDACVAAWTAGRVAYGSAERLPPDPPRDSRGLRMAIVY